MGGAISPFAPEHVPEMPAISGVRLAATQAGIKYENRSDLMVMVFEEAASVAGVFTQSKCPSAPVETCRAHLPGGEARALVVNSGNANAFTGKSGRQATKMTLDYASSAAGIDPKTVFLASTGVIGEPLDPAKFEKHMQPLFAAASPRGWIAAAEAIMTTDTYPKLVTRSVSINGATVTINGIAKGAGMIAPDMATMLVFFVTDARVSSAALQTMLSGHVGTTFNAITVDSDTSTSDTCMAFATNTADMTTIETPDDPGYAALSQTLHACMHDLALQVVSDGEGISKRMRVQVDGAATDASARRIALSIANSPLVKTAMAGEDANWGRIVMAVGKAGEPADRDRLEIAFGDIVVARDGQRAADYTEEAGAAYMKNDEIAIRVDLKMGPGAFTVWGCDLTADYVAINADYRS